MTTSERWHHVAVDESIFPLDVVLKATYWMAGRYDVDLDRTGGDGRIVVRVAKLDDILSPDEAREVEVRFRRDLIDFRTRAIVDHETRMLRELLVAKAFDDDAANA